MKWFSFLLFPLLGATALAPAHAAELSYNVVASNGQCLNSSGLVSPCNGAAGQRFAFETAGPISVLNDTSASGKSYLQGKLKGSKSVDFSDVLSTGLASTYWSRPGGDRIQLTQTGSATAMCLSWPLAALPRAEITLCSASAANQQWRLTNALPAGVADPFKSQVKSAGKCLQQSDFNEPLSPSKLVVSACSSVQRNEYFGFSNQGEIKLNGFCLESAGANSAVGLGKCGETGTPPAAKQKWKRSENSSSILSDSGQCLALNSQTGVSLEDCNANKSSQAWSIAATVAANWPGAASTTPTSYVAGQTLNNADFKKIIDWVQDETTINTTPFCYKAKAYDRGVGSVPICRIGEYRDGLLCYADCRSGFHPVGSVCWARGSLTYTPGRHCTYKLGGLCVASAPDRCRSGYHGDGIATCYIDKASYQNGVGRGPNSCAANDAMQAGLCYPKPRAGFQCTVTSCNQRCAKGLADCGPAACASNANECAKAISNQVISTAFFLINVGTAGTMGPATKAVSDAKDAYKGAKLANELAQAEEILRDRMANFLSLAENNLASISSSDIEAKINAVYPRGSADYRHIAREWAARQLLFYISDLGLQLSTFIITSVEPTGTLAVVDAFAKPPCRDRRTTWLVD